MKLVSAIAALALLVGTAHTLAVPSPVGASPNCTPDVTADGGLLYAQVFDAKPIRKSPSHVKAILPKQIVGAKMYLPAQKGMTKAYLHRAAICHMNADTPAYEHDPLRVEGRIKSLQVYPAGGAFVISLKAHDRATGKEIWRRAEILTTEVDNAVAEHESTTDL